MRIEIGPILFVGVVGFVIPGIFTVWNIYNLCSGTPKKERLAVWLTLIIGSIFYSLLYLACFLPSGDWYVALSNMEKHYSIASQYRFSVVLPTGVGFAGLIILCNVKADKLPPLISAFSTAGVVLLNIIQIAFAIQIGKNIDLLSWFLYIFHANIFILSVTAVRKQIRQQLASCKNKELDGGESGKGAGWLYKRMNGISQYTVLFFACFFFVIAVMEILFVILGQGADAPIKAFTDTADWTFSKQTPPPGYDGHYLCTVAAGGHKNVVKPLRYGKRLGETIVVNRQLCIANAFEEYIQQKLPTVHRHIRGFYNKYGYPVSKHITTPYRADVVYILMKPLEWLFVIFLYLFDVRPEERIRRQYL